MCGSWDAIVASGQRGAPGRALAVTSAPSAELGVRCAGTGWLQSLGLLLCLLCILWCMGYGPVAPVASLPEELFLQTARSIHSGRPHVGLYRATGG